MKTTLSSESIIEHVLNVIRDDDNLRRRFSPLVYKAIAEKAGFEVNEHLWMQTLSNLTQAGTLIMNYEVVDPVSKRTVGIFHSIREVPLDKLFSIEHPFMVSEQDIFITYSFLEPQTNA